MTANSKLPEVASIIAGCAVSSATAFANKGMTATFTLAVGVVLNDLHNETADAGAIVSRRVLLSTIKAAIVKRGTSLATVKRSQDRAMVLVSDYKAEILDGIKLAITETDPRPSVKARMASGVNYLASMHENDVALAAATAPAKAVEKTATEKANAAIVALTKALNKLDNADALATLGKLATLRSVALATVQAGNRDGISVVAQADTDAKALVAAILAQYAPVADADIADETETETETETEELAEAA
jgi:hypothetical protein